MKLVLRLVFLILIFAIFIICGCYGENSEINTKEVWPLEEGNYWKFNVKEGVKEKVTIEVLEKEKDEKQGETYMLEFDFGTHQAYEYYSYDEKGLLWYRLDNPRGSFERSPPEYLIKDPPCKAQEWEWEGEIKTITGSSLNYTGAGKISQFSFVELELPLGKYEALKTERELNLNKTGEEVKLLDVRYYVPKIGLVKQEVKENDRKQVYMIIDDYEVN